MASIDTPDAPPAPSLAVASMTPRLRGGLHLLSVPFAIAGLVWLLVAASTPTARIAGAVYGIACIALYAVSSGYHVLCRGRDRIRQFMQRLDHATIYIAIAGTYTPVCLLEMSGPWRWGLLLAVWAVALTAAGIRLFSWHRFQRLGFAMFLVLGWAGLTLVPSLLDRPAIIVLIAIGGVLYTVGAILFAKQWPLPDARWFGFHEVWHVFVVAAGAVFFAVNLTLVSAAA